MIIHKELVVSNRKKLDIVTDLRRHKFRPFPKVSGAKASGEDEEAEEDEDNNAGDLADYDYLLGMAIWSLTKEKVSGNVFQHKPSLTIIRLRGFFCKLRRKKWSFWHSWRRPLRTSGTRT